MKKAKVAILISGRGSNMRALIEAAKQDQYPADIVGVISNNPDADGLKFASSQGIATEAIDHHWFSKKEAFEAELHQKLSDWDTELICLAGFMRVLSPEFVAKWNNRILNIHPSLLPKYKGLDTHQRALDAGDEYHGCSVHIVTSKLDDGPVIEQVKIRILQDDTVDSLAQRLLEEEHKLYVKALDTFASRYVQAQSNKKPAKRFFMRKV